MKDKKQKRSKCGVTLTEKNGHAIRTGVHVGRYAAHCTSCNVAVCFQRRHRDKKRQELLEKIADLERNIGWLKEMV